MVVFQDQRTFVQLHDAGNEAQPQAVAGFGTALIEAHETLGHAPAVFFGDSVAMVADGDHNLVALDRAGHADLRRFALARAVFQRVVDEVGKRLRQQLAVAKHQKARRERAGERAALFLRHRLIEVHHVCNEGAGVNRSKAAA